MSEEKKQSAVELTDAELDKVAGGSVGKALVVKKGGTDLYRFGPYGDKIPIRKLYQGMLLREWSEYDTMYYWVKVKQYNAEGYVLRYRVK